MIKLLPSAQNAELHSVLIALQEGFVSGCSDTNLFSVIGVEILRDYAAKNPD